MPKVLAQQNNGDIKLKLRPAGARLRTVVDRGVSYEFPQKYSSKVMSDMLKKGEITLENGTLPLPEILKVAVADLEAILEKARRLEK